MALSRVEAAERWAAEAGAALQASQEVIRNALAAAAEAEARAEAADAIARGASSVEHGEDSQVAEVGRVSAVDSQEEIDRLREQVQQEKQDHKVGSNILDLDPDPEACPTGEAGPSGRIQ